MDKKLIQYLKKRFHLLIFGESNGGGCGDDVDLLINELLARNSCYIWDNVNNNGFERLDIGTNNLQGHDGIPQSNQWHGLEAPFTRSVENRELKITPPYFLTKTAQGGSVVQNWDVGSDYWNTFIERVIGSINNSGHCNRVCFATIGLNNAQSLATGTGAWSIVDFETRLSDIMSRIHTILGAESRIYITTFDNATMLSKSENVALINDAIISVCNSLDYVNRINTATATDIRTDLVHWTSAGFDEVNRLFLEELKKDYDL